MKSTADQINLSGRLGGGVGPLSVLTDSCPVEIAPVSGERGRGVCKKGKTKIDRI